MQPSTNDLRSNRLREPQGPCITIDPATLTAAMDRIRSHVHHWLDRLEALADATSDIDHATEQERAALQAEIERHQREWEAQVEALDHDRRLLAEAWERLEHEQIAALSLPRSQVEPSRPLRPPAPPPVAGPSAERDDMVDQAILRQFEALRRDVRRTAESRGHASP
ncbi:hypothetical protein [Tautonia marina]|uniref:hypothetical protein n=1 Tax=Tautonia marina TaxID=2653855 RepID=UPI001260ED0F|nr:hypothetical protein [Tautonia marina]